MAKLSAGVLLCRRSGKQLEVLLVHPGSPSWAKKDTGSWSIPKGEYSESDDAWVAAGREFREETGHDLPTATPIELGQVKYSNKVLSAWAIEGNVEAGAVKSNSFSMELPPKSGQTQEFPEVDKADWFGPAAARQKLVKGQVELVARLLEKLDLPMPTPERGENDSPQLTLL